MTKAGIFTLGVLGGMIAALTIPAIVSHYSTHYVDAKDADKAKPREWGSPFFSPEDWKLRKR